MVLGRRETAGVAKLFIGLVVFFAAMWVLATCSQFSNNEQYGVVIAGVALMFWLSRRPYVRPMTPAELEAEFQAGKSEYSAR